METTLEEATATYTQDLRPSFAVSPSEFALWEASIYCYGRERGDATRFADALVLEVRRRSNEQEREKPNPMRVGDGYYCMGHEWRVVDVHRELVRIEPDPARVRFDAIGYRPHWRHWTNGLIDPRALERA